MPSDTPAAMKIQKAYVISPSIISQTMIGTASRRARVTTLGRLITDAVRVGFGWRGGRG